MEHWNPWYLHKLFNIRVNFLSFQQEHITEQVELCQEMVSEELCNRPDVKGREAGLIRLSMQLDEWR
jgi:hypothetical protein